ncbi:MAG: class I SAM-dependent methyltransferase [Gammaproteobacteria bacterium]
MIRNYNFRNAFKERLCQIFDTLEYPRKHPFKKEKKIAYQSTAEFVINSCPKAIACRSPKKLMELSLRKVTLDGGYLEFGVWKGESLRYIAKHAPNKNVHGFDSFEGLPESWVHNDVGTFSVGGKLPKVPNNVTLHKGWFEDTLPIWSAQNQDQIALLHIDCDLNSATQTIFENLEKFIVSGTIIVFDDYFNFPNWEEDGHEVFTQFLNKTGHKVNYLGYAFKELAVEIQ